MTRASPVDPPEINRQDVTMTQETIIEVHRALDEVEKEEDQYQMRGETTMRSHQIEMAFEIL